jgi:hypothetical protein
MDGSPNNAGQFFYAILNVNGDKRNVNVNDDHPDDKWNDNYRVLVRESLYPPPKFGGVSFINCFCQPPSILPTSTNGAETAENFLLSIAFSSQAICKKNFKVSSFIDALSMITAFCSLGENPAVRISSASSINKLLIFSPKE